MLPESVTHVIPTNIISHRENEPVKYENMQQQKKRFNKSFWQWCMSTANEAEIDYKPHLSL